MLQCIKEELIENLKQDGRLLESAPEVLRKDQDVVRAAVQNYGNAIQWAIDASKDNVILAVQKSCNALKHAPQQFRKDKDVAIQAVTAYSSNWAFIDPSLQEDIDVVLAGIQNHNAFLYNIWLIYMNSEEKKYKDISSANDAIRKLKIFRNRDIILTQLKKYGNGLEYASEELRSDRELVLTAVEQDGVALKYASEELRSDRELVLTAVQQHGFALKYASEELRSDRELVLTAVQQHGFALQYASEELRSDRELVLTAVQQDGAALRYADQALQAEREVVLAAFSTPSIDASDCALRYASSALQGDKKVALASVANFGPSFQYVRGDLQADPEIRAAIGKKSAIVVDTSAHYNTTVEPLQHERPDHHSNKATASTTASSDCHSKQTAALTTESSTHHGTQRASIKQPDHGNTLTHFAIILGVMIFAVFIFIFFAYKTQQVQVSANQKACRAINSAQSGKRQKP